MSPTFSIIDEKEIADDLVDPTLGAIPGINSVRTLSPPDYGLWLCVLEVSADTQLSWPDRHGEEGIYVLAGELAVDGQRCPRGGALVIESDVAVSARTTEPSRLVHVGSRDPISAVSGRCAHVVGPKGWFVSGSEDGSFARWFTDGTCPTCRIALFTVTSQESPGRSRAHTHSVDEIIYVVSGTMRLGKRLLGPGTSLCIGGETRYAQAAGPGGCTFLNYRRDESQQQYFGPGEPDYLLPETALGRGGHVVGDVVDLVPVGSAN
jgi:mannose-6-phosphate isomerase-like protein (cupin superfamily)